MASVRGRGGGARGGRGGGQDGSQPKRGTWRGGPPGSNGVANGSSRANSPIITGPPGNASKQSLNDHFADLKVVDDKARKSFQTDADISASSGPKQRELKPWSAGPEDSNQASRNKGNGNSHKEAETFGPVPTGAWDQFETNKRLFGTETTWDENIYTTKLDKSAPDYKKKEKEADRLAAEIMGQSASNTHIAEERNQTIKGAKEMDEEEKYSGVARNPNAYVPPAARKSQGGFAAAAARGQAAATAKPNGRATPTGPAPTNTTAAPVQAQVAAAALASAASQPTAAPPMAASASNDIVPSVPSANGTTGLIPPAQPTRSTSDGPTAAPVAVPTESQAPTAEAASTLPEKSALPAEAAATMSKTESKDGVVDSFRRFVGTERERVEAKKQSIQKSERERQLADLMKFKDNFKIALPVPKDMLPILSKDEAKQKEIEARAAQTVLEGQRANEAKKLLSPKPQAGTPMKSPLSAKKTAMSIQQIPSFDALKKKKPPTLPVPESANLDIVLATSPPVSGLPATTSANQAQEQPKLNPKATTFSFKPNPSATAFKPGQSSTTASPAAPAAAPAVAAPPPSGPSNAGPTSQAQMPTAGPSHRNQFFASKPHPVAVNLRDDFHPWRHGQVLPSNLISPQWPYTGRKYTTGYAMNGPPSHLDEEMPAGPGPMGGMPPQFQQYYRYGMPPPSGMGPGSPMFSPNHGYAPLPGQPMHMGGPPPQNGMPMFYPNGMQAPPFLPPHQMQYNPQMGRPGPGPGPGQNQGPPPPGGPGGPPPMYYHNPPQQLSTPQHTPHVQNNLPFPSQAGQFGTIPPNAGPPPPLNQVNSGGPEGGGGGGGGGGPSPGSQS